MLYSGSCNNDLFMFLLFICWTGHEQDFVQTGKKLFRENYNAFKSNTFIVIADYNTREMPLDEYVTDIIANNSSSKVKSKQTGRSV